MMKKMYNNSYYLEFVGNYLYYKECIPIVKVDTKSNGNGRSGSSSKHFL